ncbi:UNVERIFIED_CONTAM: hypothetical protein Sangu_1452100 [Sesamum angustifolium]|uniref:Uncharacterized protein n=1 Tax=Sesamum angustifolium TaxID=2727405 RepID=A0AAW2N658_9LAMI
MKVEHHFSQALAQEKFSAAEDKIKILEEQIGNAQAKLDEATRAAREAGKTEGFSTDRLAGKEEGRHEGWEEGVDKGHEQYLAFA